MNSTMVRDVNPLTSKQQRFIAEYLVDHNATQAAKRAGYSPKTAAIQGHKALRVPRIKQEIERREQLLLRRLDITAENALREVAKIAFSDIRDYVAWGPNGVVIRDSQQLTQDQSPCVAEVSETTNGSVRFKLHDKTAALNLLVRCLKVIEDREQENTSRVEVSMSDDERRSAIIAILAKVGIGGFEQNSNTSTTPRPLLGSSEHNAPGGNGPGPVAEEVTPLFQS